MGSMSFPISELLSGNVVHDGWFKLMDHKEGDHHYHLCPSDEDIEKRIAEKLKVILVVFSVPLWCSLSVVHVSLAT